MIYEILTPTQYPELDAFVSTHPNGVFTQCSAWRKVKNNWDFEAVVCRDANGAILGAISLLIQRVPLIGSAFLYAPRGPVCDYQDHAVLGSLKEGVDAVAKLHKAHSFKLDPDILYADTEFIHFMKSLGFSHSYGPDGFEGIQARFNYRLYLQGRSEEQLFANLSQGTRRKIRIATKNGVEVRTVGLEHLDDFYRIMVVTGVRDDFNIRPKEYFKHLLDGLGDHVRMYMGFYNQIPICGAITTNYAGKCCYVYGASDNTHRDVMPNYLLQWEMIRWAVETNCTVYDFQGVSGNLSPENNHLYGLYQFKNGFNGTLDELAGEFEYVYSPLKLGLTGAAIDANQVLRAAKRRLGASQ